ncbi:hypothetical protein GCM10007385_35600 [Tateyamaria omphalii]|uniref:hypothetical protein n=1 Tax=Tateyamaria omphalii TaxID=299262 RepID=UPI001678EA4B|nr:hypothetical protein [Tateyamaria omphalii]GGX63345.1 hypothetical protein GCM10007385_35600 [Tateyamaria omphalii]
MPDFRTPVVGTEVNVQAFDTALTAALNGLDADLREEISAIVGSLRLVGDWDAGGNFPAGAAQSDYFIVDQGGTSGGVAFERGDWLIAVAVSPSTTVYAENWVRFRPFASRQPVPFSFVSDGTAGPYALPAPPNDRVLVDVRLGNVVQDVGQYSVSGSSLTFVEAVPSGLSISGEIRYGDRLVLPSTFPAGTESAPGLAVTGDTDTGLYQPSANQLAVAADGGFRVPLLIPQRTYTARSFVNSDTAFFVELPGTSTTLVACLAVNIIDHAWLISITGTVSTVEAFATLAEASAGVVEFTTGPLSGLTGTDGKITLSLDSSASPPRLWIENRLSSNRFFSLTLFG